MSVHKDQGYPVRYGIRKLNCRNSGSMDQDGNSKNGEA